MFKNMTHEKSLNEQNTHTHTHTQPYAGHLPWICISPKFLPQVGCGTRLNFSAENSQFFLLLDQFQYKGERIKSPFYLLIAEG